MKTVAIVGGGPTGLYASILLAKSGMSVVVFEKRRQYTRRQIITGAVPVFSDLGMTTRFTDEELDAYFPNTCGIPSFAFHELEYLPKCYQPAGEDKLLRSIPIQDLERGLSAMARDHNVRIIYTTPDRKTLETFDLVIGADGAASTTREAAGIGMTSEKASDAVTFHWKRDADDQVMYVARDYTPEHWNRNTIDGSQNQLFRMFSGKGESYQYGAIQIWDSVVAEKISKMTKTDGKLMFKNVEPIIGDLVRDFARLYNISPKYLERMEFNSFPIFIGRANNFVGTIGNTPVAIVGDAAIGVHFFSGSGVPSGFNLVRMLVKALTEPNASNPLYVYDTDASKYVDIALRGMKELNTLKHVHELGTCDKENADAFLAKIRGQSSTGDGAYEDKFKSSVNYCMFMNGVTPEDAVKYHAFQYYRGRIGTVSQPDFKFPHDTLKFPGLATEDQVTPYRINRPKTTVEQKVFESYVPRTSTPYRINRPTTTVEQDVFESYLRAGVSHVVPRTSRCARGRKKNSTCRRRCPDGRRFNGYQCREKSRSTRRRRN